MAVMKEGRMPLSQLVKDDKQQEQSLSRITTAMNEMLARHDNPEAVMKIVNNHMRKWAADWREQESARVNPRSVII